MPNKKIDISIDNDDKLDKIINNLNNVNSAPNKPDEPIGDIPKQLTIVDEYLEMLRLRRQIAYTLYKDYLMKLLKSDADPSVIKETVAEIGMYLGIGDRWSNDVLKNAIGNEMGMFMGFTTKVLPEYVGDPIANFERSMTIGTKDETSTLIASLLQLLGVNLSPEVVDKLTKLLKDRLGNK
jgi:hypothetical protein